MTLLFAFLVFRYRLENTTSEDAFVIDSVSGELTTVGTIDRENISTYRLTVLATSDGHLLTPSADVIIRVTDVNDNAPTLRQREPETICVGRRTSRGQTVARLEATDPDAGLNAVLKFRWTTHVKDPSTGADLFQLSQDDGDVTVKTDILAYDGYYFRFLVTVEDLGIPPRSTVGTVSIVVNDTCAVSDRRAVTPDVEWRHGGLTMLIVSALGVTALGVGVWACRRCRSRCVDLFGTVPFTRNVSTPFWSARRSESFPGDVGVQHKFRFVVNDIVADFSVVNFSE